MFTCIIFSHESPSVPLEAHREPVVECHVDGVGGTVQVVGEGVVVHAGIVPQDEQQRRLAVPLISAVQGGQQLLKEV